VNLTLQQGNCDNLQGIQDNSFDTYISNLCLMLTEDPEKMLQETHRVLKKGGKLALSVWGRPENSKIMTTVNEIMVEFGFPLPHVRTNFRFCKKEVVKNLLEKHGFVDIICFYVFTPYGFLTTESI